MKSNPVGFLHKNISMNLKQMIIYLVQIVIQILINNDLNHVQIIIVIRIILLSDVY
jgi:hypothetical protein